MSIAVPDTLRAWRDGQIAAAEPREPALLIGGAWYGGGDLATKTTVDPSTGEAVGSYVDAGPEEVDLAVRAAAAAAPAWAALSPTARADHIAHLRTLVAESADHLAALDAIDGGMPLSSARQDVEWSLEQLRDWPGLALAQRGETTGLGDGMLHYTTYRPFGVVARIVAFNHPLYFAISGMLPALLAGNAVVLKTAEQAPLSVLALGELVRRALPRGVMSIITGGPEAGHALVTHPLIGRIAFTGSTATGLKIQRAAASGRVRTVTLELGGKNPMIVFPDVSVAAAVAGAVRGMSFRGTQGQSCGSTSRVFVHRDLYDDFVAGLAEELAALRVDVAYADGVDVGPMVSAEHGERVRGYIQSGEEQGARLVTGGAHHPDTAPAGGFYVSPTLFADVTMQMRIAREEIFGPVVSVFPWHETEQLLEEVNALPYGLTASVWTDRISRALPVVDALQAGYVWVNEAGPHYWGTPFGGIGDSGIGREECLSELASYSQVKAVHMGPAPAGPRMKGPFA